MAMPDKANSSTFRSISKRLNKIASSTSNSDETKSSNKIDDVPLNKSVEENNKKTTEKSTSVIGNKDLKLKVTHNDAGRVVISLSNPDRILVQVHVDESVLKSKGSVLKKKTKLASSAKKETKDLPKKKSSTLTKSTRKSPTQTHAAADAKRSRSKRSEPRDLPEEQSSIRKERPKSKQGETTHTVPEKSRMGSSVASVASSMGSDDDSTRSPLDLNRTTPRAPTAPTAQSTTPAWDARRQKMLQRRNSREDLGATPGKGAGTLGRHVQNYNAQGRSEEEEGDNLSVLSTPFQQRRLQQRQKRLERQRSSSEMENFRSTRSVLSASSSHKPSGPPTVPFVESDACTTNTPGSLNESKSSTSHNRALHIRQPHPPLDKDDDSVNSNSRRIRRTLEEVRKVELKNKGDIRSGRSSFRNQNQPQKEDEMDKTLSAGNASKTGSNLFSKIRNKIDKRVRKGHQKL